MTELAGERGFTWVSRNPGILVTARHWTERTAGGSRVTLSLRFSGLLGARLMRGITERYLAIEARGLGERATKHGSM